MNLYIAALYTHVTCAVLSISFFVVRGVMMLTDSPALQLKFVKVAPHIIDTVLLAAAIVLAVQISQYPFVTGWLTAKLLALLLYILLGTIALRRGRTKRIRALAFAGALVCFTYIVSVALNHHPAGWLA